jgi:hypothetical protein
LRKREGQKWAGAGITAHAVSVIEPRVGTAGTLAGPGTTFKVNLGWALLSDAQYCGAILLRPRMVNQLIIVLARSLARTVLYSVLKRELNWSHVAMSVPFSEMGVLHHLGIRLRSAA